MKRITFKNEENYYIAYNKKKEKLGIIYFEIPWKKWVWQQEDEIIMSKGCLKEVIDFLDIL